MQLLRLAPPVTLALIATTGALSFACATRPAQFSTLPAPPSSSAGIDSQPQELPPPTLVLPAHHLRIQAVHELLLALSLEDEATVARLLGADDQLTGQQQGILPPSPSLVKELRTRSKTDEPLPTAAGTLLFAQKIQAEGGTALVVEVEGSPALRGKWTFVFSDAPVNRIKELQLPTRAR